MEVKNIEKYFSFEILRRGYDYNNITEDWYKFQDNEYKKIAEEWCINNKNRI